MALTAEELAMLTDEERKGYEEDEDDGENEGDEGDEGEGVDDEPNIDPEPAADPAVDPVVDPEPKVDVEPETKIAPPPVPLFRADAPADIEAKRQSIDAKEDDFVAKFDEGEITFAEYNKQVRILNQERNSLDIAVLKSDLAREAQQSQIDNTWQSTASSFVDAHPMISKNEALWSSFDTVLRRVTSEVIAKGHQPGQRELEKAYKQWSEDLGISETPKADPTPTPKAKKVIDVPPTLGKVPAATATDTDDGKWASLDRLAESDPLKFEAAMMRLSDAERDEYTRAG